MEYVEIISSSFLYGSYLWKSVSVGLKEGVR